ncbi:hypothetical protein [Acidovorax sp. SUPP2539]|uniref:hypothetical protein n=1 Tax=Acidovorax sp. SUPP2539 TaxID=2920878 RepID=UPI0023DE5EAB|nr:hypothetical protein [Acidovorax sp. SUPP2539]GKS92575.1 hypothetical protein AVTE2539_24440 [Acidovorax sp. SUPP2539]
MMLHIGVFRPCLRWAGAILASAGAASAMAATASQAEFKLSSFFFEASCSADGQFQAQDAWLMYFMPQLILVLVAGMVILELAYHIIQRAREGWPANDCKLSFWPWLRLNLPPAVASGALASAPAFSMLAYFALTGRIDPVDPVLVILGQCTSATSFTLTPGWSAFFIAMVGLSFLLAWLMTFRVFPVMQKAIRRRIRRRMAPGTPAHH